MTGLACFAVGRRGSEIAARIQAALGGEIFIPARFHRSGALRSTALEPGELKGSIATAFQAQQRIVLVLPLGAAVRLVAPLVVDKRADPAVVVVDEAGRQVIAVLSGHLGGANELAREVAAVTGGTAIITTAAEVLDTLPLDLLGKEWGWEIEGRPDLTRASAALIDGEPIAAFQDAGEEDWWVGAPANLTRCHSLGELSAAEAAVKLIISDRVLSADRAGPAIVFRPKSLAVGIGCVRGATADELAALLVATLAEHGLARESVREFATIDVKRGEEGITELSARCGCPLRYFAAEELAAVAAPSGGSAVVEGAVGTPAVCEPAAMLAAGAAELVVPKVRTPRATVAVARIPLARLPPPVRQAGKLTLVGLGPGAPEQLTGRARAALEEADSIVGYTLYLDQVRSALGPKTYHGSPIGEELERARLAIDLARAGHSVALVSSGDAGIYGTAGLAFEVLSAESAVEEAARIEVVPGVSAAQAAAALLGAPLMSDYATISLSDLMTPWEVIERRLRAVAESDLVVALYNPRSNRRTEQLLKACAILLEHRAPETPVGIVRNAHRTAQCVTVTDLEHLPEAQVDMLTTVIIGNSATIRVGDRLVTRRGYQVDVSVAQGTRSEN